MTIFRWCWTTVLVVATSAPYVINWLSTPPGYHYTGIIPPYPDDSFGYFSWAEQAARGALLFKDKYTALPHAPFLFHPFFLLCGWAGALAGGNLVLVFWLAKGIGVILLLAVFYRYCDYLQLNPVGSIMASVLLGLSSGFGVILQWTGLSGAWAKQAADLWMPEISTFWSLLWNPLFPFSLSLMLVSVWWLDRATAKQRLHDAWWSGGAAGLLALIHPYSVPLLFGWSVITIVMRCRGRSITYLIRYFAMASPFAIYVAALAWFDPIVAKHSAAGVMNSPPPLDYVMGLGLPMLLLLLGLIVLRSQLVQRMWPLLLWFGLSFLFAYLPFWYQRKFVFGAHIPLCILAGSVFELLTHRLVPTKRRATVQIAIGMAVALMSGVTSLVLLFQQRVQVKDNAFGAYYLSDDVFNGLMFLRQHSQPNEIVIATPEASRFIPAISGNTVIWGHWAMSIDSRERQARLQQIFGATSGLDDEMRVREFWLDGAQFVFVEEGLRASLNNYPFIWNLILRKSEKVFENQSVTIYHRGMP